MPIIIVLYRFQIKKKRKKSFQLHTLRSHYINLLSQLNRRTTQKKLKRYSTKQRRNERREIFGKKKKKRKK